jgi:hypothetical protein
MKLRLTTVVPVLILIAFNSGFPGNKSLLDSAADSYWQSVVAVRSDLAAPRNLQKQAGTAAYTRPDLPYSYLSADGHFLIHYTLEGNDAVDSTCTNSDGVPDWIYESARIAERTYRLLIDTLGFDAPPVDDASSPQTDLYVINVGWDYAYTYYENPVTSTPRPYDYTAYTEIDNDYAGYATPGIAALQVTIAHEYFHVVQLGYGWWQNNGLPNSGQWSQDDQYFLEWCSTWMEERAYPDVDDYIQYSYAFFYKPNRSLWNYYYAYSLGIFMRFILDRFGDDLLVKVWEQMKTDFAFESLQQILTNDYGVALVDLWNEFIYRCHYTGEHYDSVLSLSDDARNFPGLQITDSSVNDGTVEFDKPISPFANLPYQVTFGQNFLCGINASTTNADNLLGRYLLIKPNYGDFTDTMIINENQYVGNVSIGDTLVIFLTNQNMDDSCEVVLTVAELSDQFEIVSKILKIYPNPYLLGNYDNLKIDLKIGISTQTIKTTWLDLRGRKVYKKNFDGQYNLGSNTISFNSDDLQSARLASGVYILQVEIGNSLFSKKILLLK